MPSAIELAQGDPALVAAVHRSRRLLGRKALLAAAAGALPLPGVDLAADAALLARLLPSISAEFGLATPQLAHLSPRQRERVLRAANTIGAVLIGKLLTRDLLLALARRAGVMLTARQAARWVPLAGQLAGAALGYAALRTLGEQHIKDCVRVARAAQMLLPAAPTPPAL
ncbi:hypothetical protein [Xenophilus sp.]|uniref:hypothetical protein n=1 Tax=Xenophilus sp. TaxID=1873499 RepID=UPI0037DD6247